MRQPAAERVTARSMEEGWLTGADGNRLAFRRFEAAGGHPVLLLHGGGQSGRAWWRAAEWLAARGHASFIFDQRGHGDSEWLESGRYALDDFKDDLDLALEHWGRPCVLVGSSLGGLVSLLSTGGGHRLISGLVLVDTAPQLNEAEVHRLIRFLSGGGAEGFDSPEAAAEHMRAFFPERPVKTASVMAGLFQDPAGRWRWRWDLRMILGERNSVGLPHQDRMHELAKKITVPVLLLRAGRSDLVSDAAVERLKRCTPQLELDLLEDSDHIVGGADGEMIMERILPFIERCGRQRAGGGA